MSKRKRAERLIGKTIESERYGAVRVLAIGVRRDGLTSDAPMKLSFEFEYTARKVEGE